MVAAKKGATEQSFSGGLSHSYESVTVATTNIDYCPASILYYSKKI
jgi:hypothetical protein